MITFIAFLLTIAGCVNWLLIGILQYDYIAGFFGFQASIMSRIFYILFGIGAAYLVLRVIINKGTFKIWERKKKKQKEEKHEEKESMQPASANVEASKESVPKQNQPQVNFENLKQFQTENFSQPMPKTTTDTFFESQNVQTTSADSLFDEHMQQKR